MSSSRRSVFFSLIFLEMLSEISKPPFPPHAECFTLADVSTAPFHSLMRTFKLQCQPVRDPFAVLDQRRHNGLWFDGNDPTIPRFGENSLFCHSRFPKDFLELPFPIIPRKAQKSLEIRLKTDRPAAIMVFPVWEMEMC